MRFVGPREMHVCGSKVHVLLNRRASVIYRVTYLLTLLSFH